MEIDDEQRAQVVERLERAGCVAAVEEANLLIATAPNADSLAISLRRREAGEPLAWIIGSIDFCGRPLRVDAGVYVPRVQSEDLARRAASRLSERAAGDDGTIRAADLCTGAGAIARHLSDAVPTALVVGVDCDPRAAACARRNGVFAITGDLGSPLRTGSFDVVTAVAPYVPTDRIGLLPPDVRRHEPRRALDGGIGGLVLVRRVIADAGRLLRPGGWLLIEVGSDQDELLAPDLVAVGFGSANTWEDENGDLRGVTAQREGAPDLPAPPGH